MLLWLLNSYVNLREQRGWGKCHCPLHASMPALAIMQGVHSIYLGL